MAEGLAAGDEGEVVLGRSLGTTQIKRAEAGGEKGFSLPPTLPQELIHESLMDRTYPSKISPGPSFPKRGFPSF